MKLSDLVRDPQGYMSHTKLGNIVGMVVLTWIVIRRELAGTLSDDMALFYAGLLIAGMVISKGISIGATK